jgi:Fe-S cluster assembly protein SufD
VTVTVDSPAAPPAYPTKRDEAWRYAPHGLLADLAFGPPGEPPAGSFDALDDQLPALAGPRIVIVNGVVDAERSRFSAVAGLTLSTLGDAIQRDSSLAAAHRSLDGSADGFSIANVEYGVDGAVLDLAPGVRLDEAIHIVDIAHPHPGQAASCTGVIVHLGAGATATVVETRVGHGTGFGGSNVRTTVTLEESAELEHIVLQDLPAAQVHLSRVEVAQAAGSTYRSRSFNLGAAYGRLAYEVHLEGPGALADLSGLFFGTEDQTLDQQITVVHAVEGCTSRQSFHGVLDDRSTGVFNGGIEVRPGADGSDAAQTSSNLLLSDRAEVNTQPRLEILADDVTCTHGATVGQLDDTALYYLRTRGIPADVARGLLIDAFADQVVDGVGIGSVHSWITDRLGRHDHA